MDFSALSNLQLLDRFSEIVKLSHEVANLAKDITADGKLDSDENINKIVEFVNERCGFLKKFVAPKEVLLLVCGILGVLHPGDTSDVYEKLANKSDAGQN